MKGKGLKIIQIIAKVCKIASLVGFICCIVGAAGCLTGFLGVLGVSSLGFGIVRGFGVDIGEYADVNTATAIVTMLAASIVCGSLIFPLKKSRDYFTHELEEGTPFTRKLAKELRFLGIIYAAFSLGCSITVGIIIGIAHLASSSVGKIDIGRPSTIGFGAMLVIISFLCDYGTDIREKAGEIAEENVKGAAKQYNVTEPVQQYNVTEPAPQYNVTEPTPAESEPTEVQPEVSSEPAEAPAADSESPVEQ